MALLESGEMYLESIYVLIKSKGSVRSVDIAEHLNYSKPSVSRAVGILKANEYISVEKDGSISLTESGRALAEKIYERHTVLSSFLIKIGVDEKTAADDACKIEHVISEKSFEAMKKLAEN